MEIRHMHVVIALTIVFLLALNFFLEEAAKPPGPTAEETAQRLYMSAVSLGENATEYVYSYTEYSDGFPEEYTISSNGDISAVEVVSPISTKKVYFLDNDTVICITFVGNQSCSSIKNETITANYVASLKSRLFGKEKSSKARDDAKYRIENSMQVFSPTLRTKILENDEQCFEISYTINYENATLDDLTRFGLVPGSPTYFQSRSCIANQSGEIYESLFNYTFGGKLHTNRFELISSDFDPIVRLIRPANLSHDAVDKLIVENSYKNDLLKCYVSEGAEQEKCIALLALQLKSKKLCRYSGTRTDRCLVSIVPLTKDAEICKEIKDEEFLDDCYIELAGAYKNDSWCDSVKDPLDKQICLEVAKKVAPAPKSPETDMNESMNTSANETEIPGLIKEIFEEIEKNDTNSSINNTG